MDLTVDSVILDIIRNYLGSGSIMLYITSHSKFELYKPS